MGVCDEPEPFRWTTEMLMHYHGRYVRTERPYTQEELESYDGFVKEGDTFGGSGVIVNVFEDDDGTPCIEVDYGYAWPITPDTKIMLLDAPRLDDLSGAERIAYERRRQITAEGWTPEHDDAHGDTALLAAARCYMEVGWVAGWVKSFYDRENYSDAEREARFNERAKQPPRDWPWAKEWWKPSPDPIRNFEKSGALIAAEIDRIARADRRSRDATR